MGFRVGVKARAPLWGPDARTVQIPGTGGPARRDRQRPARMWGDPPATASLDSGALPPPPVPELDVVGHAPDPLHALAYVSTPTVPFSDRDLSDLLLSARRFNAAHGVTGKLVVLEDGDRVVRFAQWVEGPPAALETCLRRILADPRHGDVDVRRSGPVPARRFPVWDMAIEPADALRFPARAEALTAA